MWLASGLDSTGISAIVVAAISTVGIIAAALVRGRRSDDADEAVGVGVEAATSALADVLVKRNHKIEELEQLLDEAYQGGFVPRPPRPQPGKDRRD